MTEDGGEKGEPAEGAEPQNEPVDLDQLAPDDAVDLDQLAPEEPAGEEAPPEEPKPQSMDDAARAQAVARKLAAATGRRGALGKNPSTVGDGGSDAKSPALTAHPTTGGSAKAPTTSAATPKQSALGTPQKTAPPAGGASLPPPTGGRRPLVDPSQRKQKEKETEKEKSARKPFYAKLPAKPLVALLVLAAVGVGGWFGWKAIDRSQHADEYAVRDELFMYKFDHKDEHFATIDGMGTKAVEVAIGFLTDMRPVETSFGKSTTTTAELAHMYLIHYAQRVGVDPPTKALDVVKLGGVRMKPADWTELKDLWTKWFADVQAKGKAH